MSLALKEGSKDRHFHYQPDPRQESEVQLDGLERNGNERNFIAYPERESVPENIKEQLIVELYTK